MVKRVRDLKFDPVAIRDYVAEHFSIVRMVSAYIELYKDAIAHSNSREAA